MVEFWVVPLASVKIGDEEVKSIKVAMEDLGLNTDMLIGADFFLSHRVYVANSLHKMYFTYDGGPVFNMNPIKVVDQTGAAQTIAVAKEPEPTDAGEYSRRGAGGDLAPGLPDSPCRLEPRRFDGPEQWPLPDGTRPGGAADWRRERRVRRSG